MYHWILSSSKIIKWVYQPCFVPYMQKTNFLLSIMRLKIKFIKMNGFSYLVSFFLTDYGARVVIMHSLFLCARCSEYIKSTQQKLFHTEPVKRMNQRWRKLRTLTSESAGLRFIPCHNWPIRQIISLQFPFYLWVLTVVFSTYFPYVSLLLRPKAIVSYVLEFLL